MIVVRKIFTVSTLFFLSISFAISQVSEKQIVLGTKVKMKVPSGFVFSKRLSGYENVELSSILSVIELPFPYTDSIYTHEALKKQGMELVEKEIVTVQDNHASLITVVQYSQGIDFKKYILVFGDKSSTIMVVGAFPKNEAESDSLIRNAIYTVEYDATISVNPLENIPFITNALTKGYKLAIVTIGTYAYTLDGKIPTETEGKEIILVANAIKKVEVDDYKEYTINRFKLLPYTEKYVIKNINKITIDGLEGYEIIAYESKEGEEVKLVYFVMLYDSSTYYLINCSAVKKLEANLNTFKEIAKSFKRK